MAPAFRFIVPSLFGVFVFLTPIAWNGQLTIGIGIVTGWIRTALPDIDIEIVILLLIVSSLLTVAGSAFKSKWIRRRALLRELFDVPPVWLILRLLGTAFGLVYYLQIGPELLRSEQIGGAIFIDIAFNVVTVYISACLLLPLLTDFGFMEFIGTLARPFFRRLFQLPGRAAIDATASVIGAASVGLLITISQYERGFYTAREASVIALNFSIVSIPFSLVVAAAAGIEELFITWYATVVVICLIAAFVTPRLPPLSGKMDRYYEAAGQQIHEDYRADLSLLSEAWQKAVARAKDSPGPSAFLISGVSNLMFFLFAVVAAAMALATIAALLTFHTPIFQFLGAPLVPLLAFAHIPEASVAAAGLFAGFMDQYMPAVVAGGIDSELTSFVLAGLSVAQLVFMSEVGVIILRSQLPIGLGISCSCFFCAR
ncbi:MAG: YjiH family protein [Woeseia sp.]